MGRPIGLHEAQGEERRQAEPGEEIHDMERAHLGQVEEVVEDEVPGRRGVVGSF